MAHPAAKQATRTSPPTVRVVQVMERVAAAGGDGVRFSDLVSELRLNNATCHFILATLCEKGWLRKDPSARTYTLGSAFTIMAAQVERARPLVHAARTAMVGLVEEFGYPASIIELAGDSLVLTATERAEGGLADQLGTRVPYAAPFGVGFAAFADDAEQQNWISRGATSDPAAVQRLQELLASTKELGYHVDTMSTGGAQLVHAAAALRNDGMPEPLQKLMEELIGELAVSAAPAAIRQQSISAIAAPVYDINGNVVLNIVVQPNCPLPTSRINTIARRLTRTTAAIRTGS